MPPTLFLILETPFTQLAHALFPKAVANGIITGAFTFCESSTWGIFRWRVVCSCLVCRLLDVVDVAYDLVHYFSHHMKVTEGYFAEMKKYHLA